MSRTKVSHAVMIRRVVGASLLTFLVGVPFIAVSMSAVAGHWTLAYSPQSVSCLPWHTFIEVRHRPSKLVLGEIVLAHTRKAFHDQPLGKLVIGLPGDVVKETDQGIFINGHFWGRLWLLPWLRIMHHHTPTVPDTYVVPKGHILLLGTNPESWDGRYWGMVSDRAVYGTVIPL